MIFKLIKDDTRSQNST